MSGTHNISLSHNANRFLYVRNLPYAINGEEIYDLFGRYGAIRQIRLGVTPQTGGSAYVVYEDVCDAQMAKDNLNGYTIGNKALIVQYHKIEKMQQSEKFKNTTEQSK